jgi:prevent-host-death family protein
MIYWMVESVNGEPERSYTGVSRPIQAHPKELAMHETQIPTQTMKITDVKNQLSNLVNRVYRNETRIIVEKSGIPVAAIISARDLKRFSNLEEERAERFKIIDEIREAFKDVDPEEIERETDRIIAEIRAENQDRVAEAAASR